MEALVYDIIKSVTNNNMKILEKIVGMSILFKKDISVIITFH